MEHQGLPPHGDVGVNNWIDWKISLGTVLHLAGLIVALIWGWAKLKARLERIEEWMTTAPKKEDFAVIKDHVDELWEWWKSTMERRRTDRGGST